MATAARLRSAEEWRRVRRFGRSSHGRYASFWVLPGGAEERYGFSTTRGFRTAAARNRARRRLREAFRHLHTPGGSGLAIIGAARPEALEASWEDLRQAVAEQLVGLGVESSNEEEG